MNWFKLLQSQSPPRVMVLSYIGDILSVLINGKKYSYYANPSIYHKVDFYAKNGWYGKVLSVLNKLEKVVLASKNWFRKSFFKKAQLNGEWFLDDSGQATYADGDIGDYNHERYALECKIPEELWEKYDRGKLNKRERKEIGEEFLQYMEHGGEAREWMVEKEGWIRVHGTNFELHTLDENQLSNITSFIGEELGAYDTDELEDFDIYVEETSTGKTYDFSVQQLFDAQDHQGGLLRLLMRGKKVDQYQEIRNQRPSNELNDVINENNKRMEEGLRLISQLRSSLGDEKYKYIASHLSGKNPAIQLSMLYDFYRITLQLSSLPDMEYKQKIDEMVSMYS